MHGIFISYRRDDAPGYAGRLYDRLVGHFSADRVFMDVQGIEPGVDFVEAIERALASCEILIVLIGKAWVAAVDSSGRRRLDDPTDFVRLETATALNRGVRVVPVLVDGAAMPRAEQLPPDLVPLVRRQAVELSHKQWDATSAELIRTLEKILNRDKPVGLAEAARAAASAQAAELAPRTEPSISAASERSRALYWGLGALLVAIAAAMLYVTHPWRRDAEPAPSPAVFSVTPDRVEFAEQKLHAASPASVVTMTNRGQTAVPIGSVKIEGAAAADFVLSENRCRGDLAPGASCAISVVFNPQIAGARAATLTIAAANATTNVSIHGRGGEPSVAEAAKRVEKTGQPPKPEQERMPEIAAAPPKLEQERPSDVATAPPKLQQERPSDATTAPPKPQKERPSDVAAASPKLQKERPSDVATAAPKAQKERPAEAAPAPPKMAVEGKQPPLASVPNEIGKSRREAIADLERAGFEARAVESKSDSKTQAAPDSVLAQSPTGGEQLKPGGRVTLEVATAAPVLAAAPAGFPRVGDRWEYSFKSMWKNVEPRTFVHQVTAVSDREVRETMSFASNSGRIADSKSFGAESRFVEWRGQGYYFVEFNPFLQAFGELRPGTTWKALVTPIEDPFFSNWYSQGRVVGWESVSVPAGSFRALRVELDSTRNASAMSAAQVSPARIHYVLWYAPDAKRTVKHVRTAFTTDGTRLAEDTYELVKYAVQ